MLELGVSRVSGVTGSSVGTEGVPLEVVPVLDVVPVVGDRDVTAVDREVEVVEGEVEDGDFFTQYPELSQTELGSQHPWSHWVYPRSQGF